MNLCIDIGNTIAKLGVYGPDGMMYFLRKKDLNIDDLLALEKKFDISHIAICTTGNVGDDILQYLSSQKNCLWLDHNTKMPVQLNYETPHTLGRDRIAAAIGAHLQYPQKNIALIATGTCITMDVVNAKGVFLGGNISPGLEMKLRALHEYTAGLPRAPFHYTGNLLGKNTIEAIQNGVIKGTIWEVQSFINEVSIMYDDIIVIICGGNTVFFEKNIKNKIFAHPNLVLEGLDLTIKFGKLG